MDFLILYGLIIISLLITLGAQLVIVNILKYQII